MRRLGLILSTAVMLVGTTGALAADLTIWWTKGTTEVEDNTLKEIVARWEKETGKTAELSFYATGDTEAKVLTALKAGSPPDLTFDFGFDLAYTPTWAFDDQLADLTSVIEPVKAEFQQGALDSVYLLNGATGQRAYYAAPWVQMTPHVHYWKDMLETAGFGEADLPKDWQPFWDFWCDAVAPALRDKGERVYGIGQGSSTTSNDPYLIMHIYLNAFGAQVVAPDGTLQISQPETREKVIAALNSYVKPIKAGCVPPDAVNWGGADDNTSFLNRKNLVAMNPTLSIPLSQKADNPDVYANALRTVPWPNGVDGTPTPTIISVKQILSFKASPNPENAKSFLALLLKPETIGPMLQANGGRWVPVMPKLLADPFYSQSTDPHVAAMYKQFTESATTPLPHTYNRLYAKVMQEQLWQKAMGRIVIDGWETDKAVDELAERMTALLAE